MYWMEGWMGVRVGLDAVGKTISFPSPVGEYNTDRRNRYTVTT